MPPVLSLPIFKAPACVISTDGEGKLQINHDVLTQVEQLDGPMVCVAVAGLYRTGKSYLMNRLAISHGGVETTNGFSLGSTIESKTKGIWIWARQHPIHQGQYVLLLDTEGLGCAFKGDPNHDNWIFCLATLLSSVLCFNAKGAIDDDSLRKLNFITEMSKHIRANTKEPSDNDFDLFFPHFVYVIRDFHLDIEKEGKVLTEDEYLEAALAIKPGDSKREEDYNAPRLCIRKYFKQRKCFVFDFPVLDSELMKNLDNVHDSQLSKKFLKHSSTFCDFIFHNAPVKNLETGQAIYGRMWCSLVETYVGSIRSGCVPCVEDAVRSMSMIENTRLVEECEVLYRAQMLSGINMPTQDDQVLAAQHFSVLKEVVATFLKRSVFDKDNRFQENLNERLREVYEDLKRQNEEASLQLCREVLGQLEQPYREKMADGTYTRSGGYALYQTDVNSVKDKYSQLDYLGLKKKEVLLEFLELKMKEGEIILAVDNRVSEEERKAELAKAQAAEAERQREEAQRAVQRAEQKAAEREQAIQENMAQLEAKMKTELEQERQHHEQVLSSRLREQERLMKEGFDRQADSLQKEVSDLRQRINNTGRSRKKKGCSIM